MQINSNINVLLNKFITLTNPASKKAPIWKLTNKYSQSLNSLYLLVNFGLVDNPIGNSKDYSNIKKREIH